MAYFNDITTDIIYTGDHSSGEILDNSEITYDESSGILTGINLVIYAGNTDTEVLLTMPTYINDTNLTAFNVIDFIIDDNVYDAVINISKLTIEFPIEYEQVNLDGIYLLSKYIIDSQNTGGVNNLIIDVIVKNDNAVITESNKYNASDFVSEHVINLHTDSFVTSNIVTFSGGSVSRLTSLKYLKKIRFQKMSDDTYAKVSEWTAAESVELENGKTVEEVIAELTLENSNLEQRLANLEYKPITITSFTSSVGVVEIGSVIDNVVLKWSVNKIPAKLTLDGIELDVNLRTKTLSNLGISSTSSKKGWTITATDERNASSSRNVSITFLNGVYYGAAETPENYDSTFILSLTKSLQGSKSKTFTVTADEGRHIYYCVPTRYGKCSFNVGGFDGGFTLVDTVSFTNSLEYTEDYYIYKSDNAGLGTTSVKVG